MAGLYQYIKLSDLYGVHSIEAVLSKDTGQESRQVVQCTAL